MQTQNHEPFWKENKCHIKVKKYSKVTEMNC